MFAYYHKYLKLPWIIVDFLIAHEQCGAFELVCKNLYFTGEF